MNKRTVDKETYSKISFNTFFQTCFIMVACFITVLFVRFVSNDYTLTWEVVFFAGGIILPLSLIFGIFNYYLVKYTYRKYNDLAVGLEKACDGDFYAKLNPEKAGTLSKVYRNFNKVTDELKNVRNMQDDFVNNYSHEFKTPLTSIKGFTEILLLSEDLLEEDRRKYLNVILEETNRLTSLAEESILITKLNAQEIVEDKQYYSLSEQIRDCAILLEPQWTEKNIYVNCDFKEVKYKGNSDVMHHLWVNLINNAIKYTNKDGKINIIIEENKDNIKVIISDNGIGMNEEQISNIFEKYYQVDKSKTSKGLGLGLTIVNRVIELVNGEIDVTSEIDKGSDFKIILPK